jgi:hypothetical protein
LEAVRLAVVEQGRPKGTALAEKGRSANDARSKRGDRPVGSPYKQFDVCALSG